MASVTRSPGTLANDSSYGQDAWTNPGNAAASDNVRATYAPPAPSSRTSNYLKATNFGFSIPASATIDGIVVEIETSSDSGFNDVSENTVKLVKGGTVSGSNKALVGWITTESYKTHGSSSDLWGLSFSPSDINASNFGAVVALNTYDEIWAYIDHIQITVHYTSPDKDVSTSDSVTLTESSSMRLQSNINKSDSVGVSESTNLATSAPQITKSDSITVTESTTISIPVSAIASDSITLGENTTLTVPINTQSSDNITITESTTFNIPINLFASDSVTVTESVSNQVPVGLSVNDAINTNDSFSPNQNSFIGTSDTLNTTESATLDVLAALAQSQSITLTEAIQLLVSDGKLSVSEALSVLESFLLHIQTDIAKSDPINLTESTNLNVQTSLSLSDLITISEAYNIVIPDALKINTSEAIAVTELFNGDSFIADLYLSVFDTVSVTDSLGDIGLADVIEVGKKLVMVEGRLAYLIAGKNSFPIYVFI